MNIGNDLIFIGSTLRCQGFSGAGRGWRGWIRCSPLYAKMTLDDEDEGFGNKLDVYCYGISSKPKPGLNPNGFPRIETMAKKIRTAGRPTYCLIENNRAAGDHRHAPQYNKTITTIVYLQRKATFIPARKMCGHFYSSQSPILAVIVPFVFTRSDTCSF